jgi:hypothetical protein
MNKTRQKCKNINTSNTQSLVQYRQKQYLPQRSRHSIARRKNPRGIGWRFFLLLCILLDLIGVAT